MPLLPSSNSYNRNFVLSMGHSGVKFIIDTIGKEVEQNLMLEQEKEKTIQRPSGEVTVNDDIKRIA